MADGLSYEVEGLEDVIERLSPREAERALRNGMQVTVLRGHQRLFNNLNNKILKKRSDAGALRDSIETRVESDGNEVTGIVMNTKRVRSRFGSYNLLAIHEFGATIVPRSPFKALRFHIGDKEIFARKVVIPARKPMETTLKELKPEAKNFIREALRRRLNGEPPLGSGE